MKKFISIAIVVAMTFVMVACGSKVEKNVETTVSEKPLKFGLIALHDTNSTYDKNFIEAAKEACANKGVEYLEKVCIPETNECYEAAADLVDRGCDIVFADSFGHESFIVQAAKEFTNTQFFHATGTVAHTEKLPNYHNAFANIYEGRYLGGVAAGLKLEKMIKDGKITPEQAKIGYVGAFTYAEVISGYTSFFLGARSVVPDATMEVQFTGSWYDEALEKEATNTLINNGCVLISQHADSMGAPTACEEAGVPNVSYNGSTETACPNTFIVSSRINWVPFFEYIIDCVRDGKEIPYDWTGTIETGSVVLTEINEKAAAPETKEVLEGVKASIESGSLKVFDTSKFTVNGETLTEYKADVDTDADYTPDTDVISDGYFHESEFRSAPYFDISIDGIKTLNAMY